MSLNVTLKDNPEFGRQIRREKPGTLTLPMERILGFDTETILGKAWIMTFESAIDKGELIYPKTFLDVVVAFMNTGFKDPRRIAKRGGNKCDTWLIPTFWAWNLKYDTNAIIKLFLDQGLLGEKVVLSIIYNGLHGTNINEKGELIPRDADLKDLDYIEIKLLNKKQMDIQLKGKGWASRKDLFPNKPTAANFNVITLYDALQFLKGSLPGKRDTLANHMESIGMKKLSDTVDVTRLNDPEYRKANIKNIEKYAIQDAVGTGNLARNFIKLMNDNGIRTNRCPSIAKIAEDNLLDMGYDQTIIPFMMKMGNMGKELLRWARTAYRGGWFEAEYIGYTKNCAILDVKSDYPSAMYMINSMTHFVDRVDKKGNVKRVQRLYGNWVKGVGQESWEAEIATDRSPCRIGMVEVAAEFSKYDNGVRVNMHPISVKLYSEKNSSCLVNPRILPPTIIGYDEYNAMKNRKIDKLVVGDWRMFKPTTKKYCFKKFIDHHYTTKEDPNSTAGQKRTSKILLVSPYGKFIQINPPNIELEVSEKAGALYHPFFAFTITSYGRALLADINWLNGYRVIKNMTDGVIIDLTDENLPIVVPDQPEGMIGTLGSWDTECELAEVLVMQSGAYTWRSHEKDSNGDPVNGKTGSRGPTPTYVAGKYGNGNWFNVCENNPDATELSVTVENVLSAKQSKQKSDLSKINIFEPQTYTLEPVGNSNKRVYPPDDQLPKTFGDLRTRRYRLECWERVY